MADHVIHVPTAHINLSPTLFRKYAAQYLQCHRSFKPGNEYSPVPYFLVCRSIEFALKAMHLELKSRKEVKGKYGHNLAKLYEELPPENKVLESHESGVLTNASVIYDVPNKGFEYVSVYDAVTGLKAFPDLGVLERIAEKLNNSEA